MEKQASKRKPMSRRAFWLNILVMMMVVVAAVFLTFRWMDDYTQHGRAIRVPDVTNVDEADAIDALGRAGLMGESYDKTYVKGVPAGVVVAQRPKADAKVKKGRRIYLTVSSGNEPMVTLPDIADNSSLRQAASQLRAAGFRLTENDTIRGEADWVYKVLYNGREMHGGDVVPEGSTLTLVIGNGHKEAEAEEEPAIEIDDEWF